MGVSGAGGSGLCLSVIELGGVGPLLLILLVVLHPLQPLPGEVLEHDVVVTGGEGTTTHTPTPTRGEVLWGSGRSKGGFGEGGGSRSSVVSTGLRSAAAAHTNTAPLGGGV